MINSGMLLQPIMDPLARSDVSIGQSPCDLVPARPKLSVQMPFRDRKGVGTRATVIPAGFWRAELSKEMVLEGFQLILDYHLIVHAEKLWPFSGTSAKLVTEPLQNQRCARNSFPILSPCLLLPSHAVFGQVFKHNLRRTDPSERRSFGSVVKPRRRARAHHPQAREILGGPPHQAVRFLRVCSPKTSCPRPISVGPSFF